MHAYTRTYIVRLEHKHARAYPLPLRPLDTRSTLPVLARDLARARARGFSVACALVSEGGERSDRPARGFSKKKP